MKTKIRNGVVALVDYVVSEVLLRDQGVCDVFILRSRGSKSFIFRPKSTLSFTRVRPGEVVRSDRGDMRAARDSYLQGKGNPFSGGGGSARALGYKHMFKAFKTIFVQNA
jgi:hypothetical protein